jgi:predicted peroxiredoxin
MAGRDPYSGMEPWEGAGSAENAKAENHDEKCVGSDDPTRASFPFVHGLVLAEAGHDVQIFLVGEGTYTMRKATVDAIQPVGWPPLSETLNKVVAKRIPIFA